MKTVPEHPDFYTIKQAAIKAGTSVSTLRRLDNRGVFQARRSKAGYRLYTITDIYKLMKLLREREQFDRRLKAHQRNPQLKRDTNHIFPDVVSLPFGG